MSTKTIAQKASPTGQDAHGNAEWKNGCWHARVSLPNGKRKRIRLSAPDGRDLTDCDKDRELAKRLARSTSTQLRSTAIEISNKTKRARTTVEEFGNQWTSGELFKTHGEVRRLKPKSSADDDRLRLQRYLYPYVGDKAVVDVVEEDIERAFAQGFARAEKENKKPLRQATKKQAYQATRRLFALSIKPGRLRSDNPVSVDLLPGPDSPKLFSFLYPDELLAVLACEQVPLARRVYYALATYTGLRKSSLGVFVWHSLDFEHLTVTSLVSKTKLPQIFAQQDDQLPGLASLMVVLKRYHEHRGAPASHMPIVTLDDLNCKEDREAAALRTDLKAAGITRTLLFTRSNQVEPLRFHDLRATFVTWAKRASKGDGWISDRTGHMTREIMDRYDRGARMLADLKYVPFPDISAAIPELSNDLATNVTRLKRR